MRCIERVSHPGACAKPCRFSTGGCHRPSWTRFGVRRGDIVMAINDEKIASVDQLAGLLAVPTGAWRLSVERGGKVYSLAIQG